MALDRGTKIYAAFLSIVLLGILWALFYESPQVARLNERLQRDEQLAVFPYRFRVVRVDGDTAIMTSPRSREVPVAQILDRLFPGLGNSDPDSPLFQELQKKLARTQEHARQLILQEPDIRQVKWEVDKNWLTQHGIRPIP